MNVQMIDKIKNSYKNPIKFFGLITILLSLVLLFGCNFQLPDYFLNRELAEQIAQSVAPFEVSQSVKHLLNPKYDIYNVIFQLWGWGVVLLVFSACFKVNEFRKFKELTVLNRKLFAYLWVNISYVVWIIAYVFAYMIDLEKYVYNGAADSMGIPLFEMIGTLTFIGIIYYFVVNLLLIVTFNTKIKRIFYNFLWILVFLFFCVLVPDSFAWKFTYFHLILNLYYFVWFIFIIYSMGLIKNKE